MLPSSSTSRTSDLGHSMTTWVPMQLSGQTQTETVRLHPWMGAPAFRLIRVLRDATGYRPDGVLSMLPWATKIQLGPVALCACYSLRCILEHSWMGFVGRWGSNSQGCKYVLRGGGLGRWGPRHRGIPAGAMSQATTCSLLLHDNVTAWTTRLEGGLGHRTSAARLCSRERAPRTDVPCLV
ncbi:hypothetical protein OH76DRAFT_1230917 [Lentinus brumalis]|uniref:Uncharacterized protein n=1 Tax=Lentinus brumalis TaxID=2498619 RepID=A0A371DLZ8_9APHY|nr:hypothetical protein OH76DRAFT_1230917 [Polyporus brumalis]